MKKEALSPWTIEDAIKLYNVHEWSRGYFDVNQDGELSLCPNGKKSLTRVSLFQLVKEIRKRGWDLPVLLRFGDVLKDTISELHGSFQKAIRDAGYRAPFQGVYPIKVNQQQHVVQDVVAFGSPYNHGLEAGSKAELIAALAHVRNPKSLVVCNGYKDEEFIDLALYGRRMGIQTFIVLEMPNELDLVLERAAKIGVRPVVGIRAKLSAKGDGYWNDSGGDFSTFGLNASQVIDVVDKLKPLGMLDCLQMLHYHVGSQVTNIRSIRNALQEACRYYVDLAREGAAMGYFDVGGGLAVDYDGSHTNFASSCNYNTDEYAADIVEVVMHACDQARLEHPVIVSESGRATVAHHEVLLFNILDATRLESHAYPKDIPEESLPPVTRALAEVSRGLTSKNAQECFHDAIHYRDQVRGMFSLGQLSLRDRALAERIFWSTANRISEFITDRKYVPDELANLPNNLADIYHCNFSVFQSLPDSWAIGQLFPVVPIHRLAEIPSRQATFSDITCDCDGKLDKFVDLHDVKNTLPVHPLKEGEDYVMGVFLVGAYQETLGDLHNLFGDTNVVGVRVDEDGKVHYSHEITGDTVADVLSYVEYDVRDLMERLSTAVGRATGEGRICQDEAGKILDVFRNGLQGYTYFET